jgi:hypothetical protein
MRKRFEQQLKFGQKPISDTNIPYMSRDAYPALLASLKAIFEDKDAHEEIFKIIEKKIPLKNYGRKGMDLWPIFVLSQVRLCMDYSYDRLQYDACYDSLLRQIMGIETEFGYEKTMYNYNQVYENVSLLDEETLCKINDVIIRFGHKVFQREGKSIRAKSDSYVLECDVHFPTDYNLLWDSARKCLDTIVKMRIKNPQMQGWRKIKKWYSDLKGRMRNLGKACHGGGMNKPERVQLSVDNFLRKAVTLSEKLHNDLFQLPISDYADIAFMYQLEHYLELLDKHIDLVNRRLVQNEIIPHDEKLFSIFETYTEWIKKGKSRPNVELGKKILVTTDQYNLIIDYQVMESQSDSESVIGLADRVLAKYQIESWSFDKGFYSLENKNLLKLFVNEVVMPKKGKRNSKEKEEETSKSFIELKNQHSTIESNINELEHRGLNRCPDKGYKNYKRYVGIGVCAYNLHKIGKHLLAETLEKEKKYKQAA